VIEQSCFGIVSVQAEGTVMKDLPPFRLDVVNQCLWRQGTTGANITYQPQQLPGPLYPPGQVKRALNERATQLR